MLYVGTYTGPQSQGIYLYALGADGSLQSQGLAAQTVNPSFLLVTPANLYTVNETGKGAAVTSFLRDKTTGKLSSPTTQPAHGASPCHLALAPSGKFLAVANYSSGSAAVYPLKEDGSIQPATSTMRQQGTGPDAKRQEAAHAHCANFTDNSRDLLIADLGLDKVFIYSQDLASGTFVQRGAVATPPGSGPRHLAFSNDRRFLYIVCELTNIIAAYEWDRVSATARPLQTISILPADFNGRSIAAEIAIHPCGKFLYASNRGHDSIAMFTIDPTTGQLRLLGHQDTHGKHPRHFTISPSGDLLIVANRDSNNLATFAIDQATGQLRYLSSVDAPVPTCVQFAP